MHEWGITEDIIKEVTRQAEQNKIKKVNKIRLSLGKDSHLTTDSLKLCFDCLAKGTALENALLETEEKNGPEIFITSIEGIQ